MIPVHEISLEFTARNSDGRGHTRAVSVKRLRTAGVRLIQIEGKKIQTADYILFKWVSCYFLFIVIENQAVQEDGAIKKVPESD